jgi:hypothetical protein
LRRESIGTLTLFRFDPASPPFDDDDRDMAQALAQHPRDRRRSILDALPV